MAFAFMAFPLSNQGFCNGDPVSIEAFAPCTADFAVSHVCNPDGSATVTITISNSDADGVDITADGGFSGTGTIDANGDGTVTINVPAPADGVVLMNISADLTGAGCEDATGITIPDYTITCNNCDHCLADMQKVMNTPTDMPNVEICGNATDLFEGVANMKSDGMISSPRDITYNAMTIDLMPGFEVKAGAVFTCNGGMTVACTPFAPGSENSLTSAPQVDVNVKIAPNPVTNIAQIQYNMAVEGRVQVSVFDMKGNRVAVIANGVKDSGMHTLEFDATNLTAGFYYLTVQTANAQTTERMVIVK